jgi:hypothetical protein
MKQIYYKDISDYGFHWKAGDPTGLCKTVSGGPEGYKKYIQFQERIFGIPVYWFWVNAADVGYFDEIETKIYKSGSLEDELK